MVCVNQFMPLVGRSRTRVTVRKMLGDEGARGPTIRRPLGFLIYVEHFLVPGDQDFCFRLECRAKHQQILRFPSFKLSSSRGFGWT
jgi:hypothetical protein